MSDPLSDLMNDTSTSAVPDPELTEADDSFELDDDEPFPFDPDEDPDEDEDNEGDDANDDLTLDDLD